jgi:copper oxidase (laccase) domain-containing protein
VGVDDVAFTGGCTACGPGSFSHRARAETGRQAVLAWIDP